MVLSENGFQAQQQVVLQTKEDDQTVARGEMDLLQWRFRPGISFLDTI